MRVLPVAPLLALLIPVAHADDRVAAGKASAEKLCVGCHRVESVAPDAYPPTFRDMAREPGASEAGIREAIQAVAHRRINLPNVVLTDAELGALAAYIMSLK